MINSEISDILLKFMVKNLKKFDDIIGFDDVKQYIKENISFDKKSKEIEKIRTFLLYGPAGCGKSMIAKAIAGEANGTYFQVEPTDITSKYVGESNSNLIKVFDKAKASDNCVIFIDNADCIFDEGNELIKTLLSIIENTKQMIVLVLGTCLPWKLDKRITNKEIIEKIFYISLPDEEKIKATIKRVLQDIPVDPNLDLDEISKSFAGYSFEEIKASCRLAVSKMFERSIKNNSMTEFVTKEDIDSILDGLRKENSQEYIDRLNSYKI